MADWYRLVWPLIRRFDPEMAHGWALSALESGLLGATPPPVDPLLATTLWGRRFPNPIGLAAGFDKNARVPGPLLAQGFGFVEVGSVTPRPQPGNPKPRLFRLEEDRAVINRMGFNNRGVEAMVERLSKARPKGILGINLGKNKETEDAASDYEHGITRLARFADYLVINVSSPNTPGLRALQGREPLEALVGRSRVALNAATPPETRPPLLLKVAPDLTEEDMGDIAAVALAGTLDGLICTNTTIDRPTSLASRHKGEAGGLSGAPLLGPSTAVLRRMAELTERRLPLVGVGGVSSGRDAYAKIRAGASLVQFYSAMVYGGPHLVTRITAELADCLRADGYSSVTEAVGADII
ncbi:MAG: quinone-dependent dihydroorotate dehydrogenase [Rhodospirillum sp.]|nr:quinone-dependent dihydroorotate dehydrogenase [Rhodospirillum sp.]MCF8489985.1 quinone-dependent dihydroorotate dehydrogenase [Rhodospirillum sp.]MCF8501521.1 quinone-dependent dihydroorotate dehydrogenase [Rhodospirillum sp.]